MVKNKKTREWVSLQDIVREKLFPWAGSFWLARKIVVKDRKGSNILQPIITGRGRGKKYRFKEENITKFVTLVETGKVRL